MEVDASRAAGARRSRRTGEASAGRTRCIAGSVLAKPTMPSPLRSPRRRRARRRRPGRPARPAFPRRSDASVGPSPRSRPAAATCADAGVCAPGPPAGHRRHRDVAHPQRHRRLRHAELGRDVGHRHARRHAARAPRPAPPLSRRIPPSHAIEQVFDAQRGVSAVVEVVPQLLAAVRVAQLGQRLRLDLADAFAGHAERLADLLERVGLAVLEAEPQSARPPSRGRSARRAPP